MIHNHGTEDGPGLSCPEARRHDGTLRGACLPRERWTFRTRVTLLGQDWYVWDCQDTGYKYVTPVANLIGRTVTQ